MLNAIHISCYFFTAFDNVRWLTEWQKTFSALPKLKGPPGLTWSNYRPTVVVA